MNRTVSDERALKMIGLARGMDVVLQYRRPGWVGIITDITYWSHGSRGDYSITLKNEAGEQMTVAKEDIANYNM